jgi:hypothetical protein
MTRPSRWSGYVGSILYGLCLLVSCALAAGAMAGIAAGAAPGSAVHATAPDAAPPPPRSVDAANPQTGDVIVGDPAQESATNSASSQTPRPSASMNQEIAATFAAERATLAELQARFSSAATEAEALAIQQQIDRVKQDAEIGTLRIQARYARQAGYEQTATELEAVVAQLLSAIEGASNVAAPAATTPLSAAPAEQKSPGPQE